MTHDRFTVIPTVRLQILLAASCWNCASVKVCELAGAASAWWQTTQSNTLQCRRPLRCSSRTACSGGLAAARVAKGRRQLGRQLATSLSLYRQQACQPGRSVALPKLLMQAQHMQMQCRTQQQQQWSRTRWVYPRQPRQLLSPGQPQPQCRICRQLVSRPLQVNTSCRMQHRSQQLTTRWPADQQRRQQAMLQGRPSGR